MSVAPTGLVTGLDVLQRALDHTCAALRPITPDELDLPTPCANWRLADLLAHMEDALDAFAEAAGGSVALGSTTPAPRRSRIGSIQRKAGGLLALWMAAADGAVTIDDSALPLDTVVRVAALEIAVHGWDVDRTRGVAVLLPEELAASLLPTAALAATAPAGAFAPPVPARADAPAAVRLLALLGRRPGAAPSP